MKTDPSETGGLFVGRRPGTAPVHYRDLPVQGSAARRRADSLLAAALLALMSFLNLLFWGPIPAGALWIASQLEYQTGSVSFGIFAGFAVLLVVLFGALMVLKRIDHAWILVRRAAGHDQREGMIGRIFAATAAVGAIAFAIWLFVIEGPGPSLAPNLA